MSDAGLAAVVLVEGASDAGAVRAVAQRSGLDLSAARIAVVPMGGITNIGHFVRRYGPSGADARLTGLCDLGEQRFVRRALDGLHRVVAEGREGLAAHGFFICDTDLEDELIRAAGIEAVLEVIEENGDLLAFRRLQQQPAQRELPAHRQLHRFFGSGARRKISYAPRLVAAIAPDRLPSPLAGLRAVLRSIAGP